MLDAIAKTFTACLDMDLSEDVNLSETKDEPMSCTVGGITAGLFYDEDVAMEWIGKQAAVHIKNEGFVPDGWSVQVIKTYHLGGANMPSINKRV